MGSVDTWVGYWGRLRPDRPALAAGGAVVTWGSLAERSSRLAAGLAAAGTARGSRIGVLSRDPVSVIEIIAACARLGTVAVPLDHAGDPDQLRGLGLWALMTDLELAQVTAPEPDDAGETRMDDPLLLLGTRVLTHANVEAVALAAIAADGLVPADCVAITRDLASTPTGLATALGALHAGALVRFDDDDADLPSPTVLVTTCEQLERRAADDTGGLRLVKVPGPVRETVRREWGSRATPFVEMYGVADAGGLNLQQSIFGASDGLVPLLGQRALVVDDTGAAVPAGQPGELVLAGTAVGGDGWLRTGDQAVEGPDGSLTILGRQQ